MPIAIRMKPTLVRRNRRRRTAFRKWAKTAAAHVAFQVEHIFCPITRLIEREPYEPSHQSRAAMAVMEIAAAHGYYRQWAGEVGHE